MKKKNSKHNMTKKKAKKVLEAKLNTQESLCKKRERERYINYLGQEKNIRGLG